MGASATKHFFQRLSTVLATASSQHALSLRIMDRACCDEAVEREVESLWKKRFLLQMLPSLTRLDSYFYNEVLLLFALVSPS